MARRGDLELTGVLATSDPQGRLRLCLVDGLEARGGAYDSSWRALVRAVPEGAPPSAAVPYRLDRGGASDSAGVRGECWVTVPPARRARIEELARALRGREVRLTARPRRYAFDSRSARNRGARVEGTSLAFVGLELLEPDPAGRGSRREEGPQNREQI
jgi:hypothetical protein